MGVIPQVSKKLIRKDRINHLHFKPQPQIYNTEQFKGQIKAHMHSQFRLGDVSPLRYFFGITLILGVVFGLIRADDASELSTGLTIFQWIVQTTVPMLFLLIIHLALQAWQPFNHLNPWLKLTLSGILGGLLFTPLAYMLDIFLLDENWPSTATELWLQMADEAVGVVPPVVIVWLAVNAPWVMRYEFRKIETAGDSGQQANDQTSEAALPPFMQHMKTPVSLDDILFIKADLHYLEVITNNHRELVLYNLKDAITELPADLGAQCHRSYWVAHAAIQTFKKKGREGVLLLKNDMRLPVSRSRTALFKS